MKVALVINLPNDIHKTNEIYQSFQDIAFKNGVELIVEVNGLLNVDNKLKDDELDEVNSVIIVSDDEYKSERLSKKNVINITYSHAIISFDSILKNLLSMQNEDTPIINTKTYKNNNYDNENKKNNILKINKIVVEKNNTDIDNPGNYIKKVNTKNLYIDIYKHIKFGITSIIPFIITSGLLTIILYIFNLSGSQTNSLLSAISRISTAVFSMLVPVLCGFIAMSISDSLGFMPGLVGGALISISGGGYISGIIVGLSSGYLTKYINNNIKSNEKYSSFKKISIQLLMVLIVGLVTLYIGAPIIKFVYRMIEVWIYELSIMSSTLAGGIIGILLTLDFGTSAISRAVISSTQLLVGDGIYVSNAAVFATLIVVPLGLFLSTLFAKVKFYNDELILGKLSLLFGIAGLLPIGLIFAIQDPLKVILSCMAGSAISGILVSLFGSGVSVITGGLLALTIPDAFINIFGFIVSVAAGSLTTGYLYSYLRNYKS